MSAKIERELATIKKILEAKMPEKWLSQKQMELYADKTTRQLKYLRQQYPSIYRFRGGTKVDTKGRTIRRGIEYSIENYNAIFTYN